MLLLQVECKKAQPKEVVQAANTAALLGKRVILSNLGLLPGLATAPGAAAPAQPAQQHHHQLSPGLSSHGPAALQAALQQQLAASAALGKNWSWRALTQLQVDNCIESSEQHNYITIKNLKLSFLFCQLEAEM